MISGNIKRHLSPVAVTLPPRMRMWFALLASGFVIVWSSSSGFAGITNSKHDLTIGSTGPSDSGLLGGIRPCEYCHAPHNAKEMGARPLWNRSDPVTVSFTMYGATLSGYVTESHPKPASLRCLSCHDGATAVDAFNGNLGTSGKMLETPYAVGAGGILLDDHPVSISAASLGALAANAMAAGLIFYDEGGNSTIECPTCHDPHLTDNGKFLRVGNNGDTLCQVCHAK